MAKKYVRNLYVEYVDVHKTVVPKKVLEAALAQFGPALVNKS